MRERIGWGILGTAAIATRRVIPALQASSHGEVVAIASRSSQRAQEVATRFQVGSAHGSYEELLENPRVDAVYIPLPNHLHVPWSVRALTAGKHVLCEKPIACTAAEAEQLLAAARIAPRLKVMEAFMYRFHPRWHRVVELMQEGVIGGLRATHATFSYFNDNGSDIRNQTAAGGGALLDIGCYAISTARLLHGREPQSVRGVVHLHPVFGTDQTTSAILDFGNAVSTFLCSTLMEPHQHLTILGTSGRIELELAFNPPAGETRITMYQAGKRTEIAVAACDHYVTQGDAFARAILDDAPAAVPLEDAIANMRVIDAIFESALP